MNEHRVIFPDPELWNREKEHHMTDHINRINNAPMSELPHDMIRTASTVQLMIGAAPDGHSITVGLLFKAAPPIGAVEYMLTATQITDLHDQLADFINLNHDELAALRDRLHGDEPA
jgi:hypothetical protein